MPTVFMLPGLLDKIENIGNALLKRGQWLCTAESCTGGGIGEVLTSMPGSSGWYRGGFVSYSNQMKMDFLKVSQKSLENYGAVSEQVAAEMALGAAKATDADVSISTSGIAGPDGGSAEKPVGTVCFGFYIAGELMTETCHFEGDRHQVRSAAGEYAIAILADKIIFTEEVE